MLAGGQGQNQGQVERYELLGRLAAGGMATVYLGRQRGPFGFTRAVAIKSMHEQYANDDAFRTMFVDEATLSARISHPNVVPTLDIVCAGSRLLLVMEYIHGVALSTLTAAKFRRKLPMTIEAPIASAIICDALHGLHAAHELADDDNTPLRVVHRDVSPQNILVGVDGTARVLDFGVAKATTSQYVTQSGGIKGKIAYMAPEQLQGKPVDRRADVYSAGVVLWEMLTGRRLFSASNEGELVCQVLAAAIARPSSLVNAEREQKKQPLLAPALDQVVLKALSTNPDDRFHTADEMATALFAAVAPSSRNELTLLVRELASDRLDAVEKLRKSPVASSLESEANMLVDILTHRSGPRSGPRGASLKSDDVPTATPPVSSRSGSGSAADSDDDNNPTVVEGFSGTSIAHAGPGTTARSALASQPWSRGKVIAIATGIVALVTLSAAFALGSRKAPTTTTANADPPPLLTTPTPSTSHSIEQPVPSASVVASAAPSPPRAAAQQKPRAKPGDAAHPAASSSKKPDCRVPYVIDEEGHRHYLAECVR